MFDSIFVRIITLLFLLFLVGFGVFALIHSSFIVAIMCFIVAAGFGFFSYLDYKRIFVNKKLD